MESCRWWIIHTPSAQCGVVRVWGRESLALMDGPAPLGFAAPPTAWGNTVPFCGEKNSSRSSPRVFIFGGYPGSLSVHKVLCFGNGGEEGMRGKISCRIEIRSMTLGFPACLGGEIEEIGPVISIISIADSHHCSSALPGTPRSGSCIPGKGDHASFRVG